MTGNVSVGGLVGFNNVGTVKDSYARGDVTGLVSDLGGLIGRNGEEGRPGTVETSYATGFVIGQISIPDDPIPDPVTTQDTTNVGGLVGNNSAGAVTDSYWDVNTTTFSVSDGGTGLTTAEMNGSDAKNSMQGFDFTGTWDTVSGDYPILAWQEEEPSGPLSSDNPFGGPGNQPVGIKDAADMLFDWNQDGEVNGTSYTESEMADFLFDWNLAR